MTSLTFYYISKLYGFSSCAFVILEIVYLQYFTDHERESKSGGRGPVPYCCRYGGSVILCPISIMNTVYTL